MRTVLITGANRGIGLEFARQCVGRGDRVFVACRRPEAATELGELARGADGRCEVVPLDLASADSIAAAAGAVAKRVECLDLLINNAGTLASERGLASLNAEAMLDVFRVNVVGTLAMTRACWPMLRRAGRPVCMSLTSRIGVLRPGAAGPGGGYSYALTKAALHRAIPLLAGDLKGDNIVVVGIDPGWVETDMTRMPDTGNRYQLSPAESVGGMLAVADRLTIADTGGLWRWNGQPCRWYPPEETPEERQLKP